MNMLSFVQERPQIRKELSRRIGYTNGLHDIFRFARVVTYLRAMAPATTAVLRSAILENENVRGAKYADGVIDVAKALSLIDSVGSNLVPSDAGYALYAVQQFEDPEENARALLLNVVLEADGDATLNLLDLLAINPDSRAIGRLLIERLLQILETREEWVNRSIVSKTVRDMVIKDLSDSKERLRLAADPARKQTRPGLQNNTGNRLSPEQKVQRFFDHTIVPRRGWLKDLGCIEEYSRGQYRVTDAGHRLLDFLKMVECYSQQLFVLPFSAATESVLGVQEQSGSRDWLWQATATVFADQIAEAHIPLNEHIERISTIFPHVKLRLFNEATTNSLYCALCAQLAVSGKFLALHSFEDQLDAMSGAFPERLYRLRHRRGGSGYVALRA